MEGPMSSLIKKADSWQRRADDAKWLAENVRNVHTKRAMLLIAAECETIALHAKRLEVRSPVHTTGPT